MANIKNDNGKIYVDGRLVYDTNDPENDPRLLPDEDTERLRLYDLALYQLSSEHWKYGSNYRLWGRWDITKRLRWLDQIEQQAKDGKQTIGVDVVTRVAILRLEK